MNKETKDYIYAELVLDGVMHLEDEEPIPSMEKLIDSVLNNDEFYTEIGASQVDKAIEFAKNVDREKFIKDCEKSLKEAKTQKPIKIGVTHFDEVIKNGN